MGIIVSETTKEEDFHKYDTVVFFCPECKSMLSISYHYDSTCVCGNKWRSCSPICTNKNIKSIREINGEEG
jgi:hypothetical protein